MNDAYLITLTQFEKTGSVGKFFIPLENFNINIHLYSKLEKDSFFNALYNFTVR